MTSASACDSLSRKQGDGNKRDARPTRQKRPSRPRQRAPPCAGPAAGDDDQVCREARERRWMTYLRIVIQLYLFI
jgi:hypothetical protein